MPRVALIAIIVEDMNIVKDLNAILHAHYPYIIGRMGIPYKEKKVHVISIALDAPKAVTDKLTDKIAKLRKVTVRTTFQSCQECPLVKSPPKSKPKTKAKAKK